MKHFSKRAGRTPQATPIRNMDLLLKQVQAMSHDRITNYIVPGLSSSLVGGPSPLSPREFGKVRLFEASRETEQHVLPHSHRFALTSFVLRGSVINTLYVPGGQRAPYDIDDLETAPPDSEGEDIYAMTKLTPAGRIGNYRVERDGSNTVFSRYPSLYGAGDVYHMEHDEFHSIRFSKDAVVLILEGPEKLDHSYVLEPMVDGKVVPVFAVRTWMFEGQQEADPMGQL